MVHTMETAVWFGVVVVGAVALVGTAAHARTYWDEPGGEAFSGLATAAAIVAGYVGVVVVSGSVAFEAAGETTVVSLTGVLAWPVFAYLTLFPLLVAVFAARRKGLTLVTRRRAGLASAGLLAGLVANQVVEWLEATQAVMMAGGAAATALTVVRGLLSLVLSLAVPALLGAGVVVLLFIAYENEHVAYGRRVLLSVGVVVAWLLPIAYWVVPSTPSRAAALAPVGVATATAAAAFGLAVTRYDVFAESVAANAIGRDEVVETMEDAVLVVNTEGEVLDLNPVARRLFEVEMAEAAGEDVGDVVGEPLATLRTTDLLALETLVGFREFEPRASVVTGAGGETVGFSVVLRDVTERRTREERLQVLNRVLRHNLRNEVSVISGYAELLGEAGVALDRAAREITETAYDLAEIGEKARTIEQMMAEPPNGPQPVALVDAVERAVEPVARRHEDCNLATELPDDVELAANPNVLVPVVRNLVENAAEHNDRPDPHVEVRASEGVDPGTVTITIVDDGPGIPEDEREVLSSGDVTPLEHGSGLGLWIAKWGVTRLGGELSFSPTEPRGTIVTIRLPTEGREPEAIDPGVPGVPA